MSKFAVMLAHPFTEKKFNEMLNPVIEPKLDGVRVIVHVDHNGVRYYSRNGRELKMFKSMDREMTTLAESMASIWPWDHWMFDGEMMSATFNEMAGTIHRKDYQAGDTVFYCFHAMPLLTFHTGRDTVSQADRRYELLLQPNTDKLRFPQFTNAETVEHIRAKYDQYRSDNFEGAMVKDLSQPWVAKRSHAWLKLKDELSVDVPVTGVLEGEGKYKGTCGTLVIDYKGVSVPVSGMTDAQRHEFWANPDAVIGRIVEVVYQEETVHGSLRHPRFKRFREDKE